MTWKFFAAGALAVLATVLSQPSFAQSPIILSAGGSFMEDGLTFTVSGCTSTNAGSNSTKVTASCSGNELEYLSSTGGDPTLEILSTTSGSDVLSGTPGTSKSADTADISFVLTVTGTKAGRTGSISDTLAGTSKSADVFSDITGSDTQSDNLSQTQPISTSSFTTATSESFNVELGIQDSTSSLALLTDQLHFSPAPEPASIAVLLTGLTGLVAARRRSKGRTPPTKAAA